MIYQIIRSLHIYKNEEEFYQIGLIGLWEAQQRFDEQKGRFFNFAYSFIKGRILTEMFNMNKDAGRVVYPKAEYWELIRDEQGAGPFENVLLLSCCQGLTKKEQKWLLAAYLEDRSVAEIAEAEKVSISAVKQWRKGARKKLRRQLEGIH